MYILFSSAGHWHLLGLDAANRTEESRKAQQCRLDVEYRIKLAKLSIN